MENYKLLTKMNEIYFTKLKQHISEKLEMQYQPSSVKVKDEEIKDIKTEIVSSISIYSIMADCLLKETDKATDAESIKKIMKEDIKKATKDIQEMFNNYTNNRMENYGNNKILEYKQALFNEIINTIVALKEENTIDREQEV